MDAVVAPLDHLYVKGAVPDEALTVAVPSVPRVQVADVEDVDKTIGLKTLKEAELLVTLPDAFETMTR